MPSYLSINEFPGDGVTTQHEFSFAGGYIDKSHVKASVYDALGAQTIVTITEPMWIGPYILNLGVAAPVGGHTRIYRDTPREEPLADFADRARLREANLDLLARQAIFVGAEAFDAGAYAEVNDLLGQAAASAAASLAAANDAGDAAAAAAAHADDADADAAAAAAFAASINPAQFLPLAGGTMTGHLNVPPGASGVQAPRAQEVAVLSTAHYSYRNKLINGDWSQNVRGLTSVADDTYFLDRWYALTETGNVTVAQLTDAESGAPFGVRLTQPNASPQRIGFAQIIESRNIRQFASRAMHLAARLRLSAGGNIRYAVIEHTGTADVVTSDVVGNWASATFTPSNFFIAGVNVISTGTIAPGAATWGEVSDWDALGASVKNVIVFIWTEAQVAQNVTLDCSRIQYEPGVIATPHEWRLNEDVLCSRYAYPFGVSRPNGQASSAATVTSIEVYTPSPMRATPAISAASHNFTNPAGAQVGPFTVVVTSVSGIAVRLDASSGSGLVAGDMTVMVPAAGTFLSAEL